MKIDSIYMEPFKTILIKSFKTANKKYNIRTGWYLKIESDNLVGIGEISPLNNFSPDYNLPIGEKINEIIDKIIIIMDDFSLDEYNHIIKNNLQNFPSVQFGFEIAIYDLLSKKNNLSLSKYWNINSLNKIYYNSVIDINSSILDINNVVKIKITTKSIEKNKRFFEKIFQKNEDVKLRLDFNGSLNLNKAKKWINELSNFKIEYIEQPLPSEQLIELSELRSYSKIPIAVDESITNLESAYQLIEKKSADIFIIKPMISGGYENSKKIVELGNNHNIKSIITTSLETEIGFLANLHIASALKINEHCGFSTWKFFTDKPPTYIKKNYINLSNQLGLGN